MGQGNTRENTCKRLNSQGENAGMISLTGNVVSQLSRSGPRHCAFAGISRQVHVPFLPCVTPADCGTACTGALKSTAGPPRCGSRRFAGSCGKPGSGIAWIVWLTAISQPTNGSTAALLWRRSDSQATYIVSMSSFVTPFLTKPSCLAIA